MVFRRILPKIAKFDKKCRKIKTSSITMFSRLKPGENFCVLSDKLLHEDWSFFSLPMENLGFFWAYVLRRSAQID